MCPIQLNCKSLITLAFYKMDKIACFTHLPHHLSVGIIMDIFIFICILTYVPYHSGVCRLIISQQVAKVSLIHYKHIPCELAQV